MRKFWIYLIVACIAVVIATLIVSGKLNLVCDLNLLSREFSQIGTIVILPIILAWFNSNLKTRLNLIDGRFNSMAEETKSVHNNISLLRRDIDRFSHEVITLINTKDLKAQQRRNILNIQDFCVNFMDYQSDLKRYAVMKADSFRKFTQEVHDMDIKPECLEPVVRLGIDLSEQMRVQGYSILGKDFIDYFYEKHIKHAECYFKEISRIFTDGDNSKHERFQEKSEQFLKAFLSNLNVSYIDFMKKSNSF